MLVFKEADADGSGSITYQAWPCTEYWFSATLLGDLLELEPETPSSVPSTLL